LIFARMASTRVGDPAGCVEGGAAGASALPATASLARPVDRFHERAMRRRQS
jgi:hypothetical protein